MIVDLKELSTNQVYYTFIQTIIPRPIAWVLSDNGAAGSYNLAPFSYFNGISSNPPLIMLSIGKKPDGSKKDTWVNIDERRHFVIHIPHREWAEAVTLSSATLPHGESELNAIDLETVPFYNDDFKSEDTCPLPRLKAARIAFACEKEEIIEIGNTPQGLIIGRVKHIYIADDVGSLDEKGRLNVMAEKVDPLSRLGGTNFGLFGEIKNVPRPK